MDIAELLRHGSARAIGHAVAARQITSTEVTRWYLDRIERFDRGVHGINSVRSVSPMAIASAERADREIEAGRIRGPLHGVPYLVKDNMFTTDGCTAAAGAAALATFVPPYQATLVTRLSEAGAVLLGKTNLTEFADFVSDVMPAEFSGAGGVVRNPLGIRYDRGQGSSVGSAAAVAARFCAFAIGSETQNSIQTPATHSSIVGFKATVGLVSRHGVVPLVPSQDSPGTLTICVEDAWLVLQAIAGPDVRDSATLSCPMVLEQARGAPSLHGLRIGVPRRLQADLVMSDEMAPALDRVLNTLSEEGAVIVDPCDLPTADPLHEARSCVFRTEFKASLNSLLSDLRPCGIDSMETLIRWNELHPQAVPFGQSLLQAANATDGVRNAQYLADRRRDIVLSDAAGIVAAMQSSDVDVLLVPMTAAARCTGKAGAPVVSIPAGQYGKGAPFGITLFSNRWSDGRLLKMAAAVEKAVGDRVLSDV